MKMSQLKKKVRKKAFWVFTCASVWSTETANRRSEAKTKGVKFLQKEHNIRLHI